MEQLKAITSERDLLKEKLEQKKAQNQTTEKKLEQTMKQFV